MSKHLTMKQRIELQVMIETNSFLSLAQAAKTFQISPSSVFREIKQRRIKLKGRVPTKPLKQTPVPVAVLHNRTYQDYLAYIAQYTTATTKKPPIVLQLSSFLDKFLWNSASCFPFTPLSVFIVFTLVFNLL